ASMPEDAPTGVSDPDPLCFVDPPVRPLADVAQSSLCVVAAEDPESENASSPTKVESPGGVYRPEWGVTNDMDLFSLIRAPNPTKVKVGSRPHAPHEVPLLTLTDNHVIEMDDPSTALELLRQILLWPRRAAKEKGDLRKFSDIRAWVHVPRCIAWLDYDEHVDSLSTMDNEVGVTSPESTTQTLLSFDEYTPPVTYPKEVEKTLGTPIEVEPLNETKLEEVGLNCNHKTLLSSREVPSFDRPEPQPLLNSPSLDVSVGDVIGPEPPIKSHSPDSSRVMVVDYLTTQTPPSPHVANSHLK
nr:hypothetical protein [Tanacetum cinerariifolium]